MNLSVLAVQQRIAEIRALTASPTRANSASSVDAAAFADTLSLGDSGTGLSLSDGGSDLSLTGGTNVSATLGRQAVTIAQQYLGVDYQWGGTDPSTGLDCSGLTQLVYRQLGIELPRTSRDQAKAGVAVPSLDQAQAGDLLFFGSPVHHVGIYVGNGKMLDAPKAGDKVKIQDVWETPTQIRRVTGTGLAGASVGGSRPVSDVPYAAVFNQAGARNGVDPSLLAAVAKAESGFRPTAVSSAGAQGLMQLMPGTARDLGVDPLDPNQAVDGAARLLKQHLTTFGGDTDRALAAYNAGAAAVRRYDGIPPFKETQDYVKRVNAYQAAIS